MGQYRKSHQHINSDKILYLCISIDTFDILKVGQTTNWKNRLPCYSYRDKSISGIFVFLFETNSWNEQDKLEVEIRKYLESNGHRLIWDNTNQRLTKTK